MLQSEDNDEDMLLRDHFLGFLDIILLEDQTIESFLDRRQRQPDYKVGLQRHFILEERSIHQLYRDCLEDGFLGPSKEERLVNFLKFFDLLKGVSFTTEVGSSLEAFLYGVCESLLERFLSTKDVILDYV